MHFFYFENYGRFLVPVLPARVRYNVSDTHTHNYTHPLWLDTRECTQYHEGVRFRSEALPHV